MSVAVVDVGAVWVLVGDRFMDVPVRVSRGGTNRRIVRKGDPWV